MDWKTTEQSMITGEWVFDGALEQSVESDYVLPDYLPDIARVLKCRILPTVALAQVNGDQLTIEGNWQVRLYYLSAEDKTIHTAEIKYPFSKSQELRNIPAESGVETSVHTDYCNCRVVNKRRIDVRGAFHITARVLGKQDTLLLDDAFGCGVQLQKQAIEISQFAGMLEKQFAVSQLLALEGVEKQIDNLLLRQADVEILDHKIIPGKIMLKGVCHLTLICQTDAEQPELFVMDRDLPFSQVIETDLQNEDAFCQMQVYVVGVEAVLPEESVDLPEEMTVNLTLLAQIKCYEKQTAQLTLDAFSTEFPLETETATVHLQQITDVIDETGEIKEQLTFSDNPPVRLFGVTGELHKQHATAQFGEILMQGEILYTLLGEDADGNPGIWEKIGHYELLRKVDSAEESFRFDGSLTLRSVKLQGLTDQGAEISAQLSLLGVAINLKTAQAVISLQPDTEHPKEKPAAAKLVLYFPDPNESIWDIAKRYDVAPDTLEENSTSFAQNGKRMLLIPTI